MKKIEMDVECSACKGTGLYVGFGEKNGAAIVCSYCKGTGKYRYIYEYNKFSGRKMRKEKIKKVYKTNPGIGIGTSDGFKLDDFGGMPYEDWKEGKPFPPKSEMREYTCPAWWYQCVDYKKKPNWEKCKISGTFSSCKHFIEKEKCWERFDKEISGKED